MPTALESLITVEEAADLLRVSPRRVHQFIEGERLKVAAQVGPVFMLDRQEVRIFSKKQRNPGRPRVSGKK